MTWDVLLAGDIDESEFAVLEDIATLATTADYADEAALRADVGRFEAIVVRSYELDGDLLRAATDLEVISKRGVGLDSVDVAAATERGVVVCNTPGANARAVAEHALGLLLAVRKRLLVADRDVRAGEWNRGKYVAHELGGDVLGLFGLGNTGRTFADLADGIGVDCLAYDPYVADDEVPVHVERVATPAELFERADAVSVHVPLTDETRGAVGSDELERLSPSGILLNTSRGAVVDESALVAALESGTVGGAGLDVYETEPPDPSSPLFDLDSVVLTPHVAGTTHEADAAKSRRAAEHVRMVHEGEMPPTAVNADDLTRP